MSILDLFRISSFKTEIHNLKQEVARTKEELEICTNEVNALHSTFDEIGAGDAIKLREAIDERTLNLRTLEEAIAISEQKKSKLQADIKQLQASVTVLDEDLLLESFALYKPKFAFTNSTGYKDRLSEIRLKQKAHIKAGTATVAGNGWTVNGSAVEGRKMVADMTKLLLRSFNNECDYCVDNVRFSNIESFRGRIEKSFDAINKLGRIASVRISHIYKDLKLEELDLAFEYQEKKQEEKEEARRLREEQREQQKLEQEIRAARAKIAKERKHFNAALSDLNKKILASSDTERLDIQAKIDEISSKLSDLDGEEKVVDYRENNAKAGYVYIISNIGAFGEGVYKIGMTRRLEPIERIHELGDASVPFAFDVHAMIFSDNAPALEAKLHSHFWKNRLNKVNGRKEFFKADLMEVEAVIRENYDRVFDLIHQAPAEQYREGLKMTDEHEI